MRPYSPGGALNGLPSAATGRFPRLPSAHRLRRGLPGYLILFATTLSRLSVRYRPGCRFRHRRSSRYLRISPLHLEFHIPLLSSSTAVRYAVPGLSHGISHTACHTAYTPFMPSESEQRLPPSYYRSCWHEVSCGFLWALCQQPWIFTTEAFISPDRSLQPEGLLPPRGVAPSDFRPLRKILDCSLP